MQHRDNPPNKKTVPGKNPAREQACEEESYIQPAEFSFGTESTEDKAGKSRDRTRAAAGTNVRGRSLLQIAIAGGMITALVGVFWVLPNMVEKPNISVKRPATDTTSAQETSAPKLQKSPYSEAEITQQRRDVQKVLQDILQLQDELTERRVEVWAAEAYFAARTLAEEADGIYRQRKFMQALQQYREALDGLQEIRDSIPDRIEQHLSEGHAALDIGDAEAAHEAFDLVLTISEDHPRGTKGKARAEKLPEVWPLFTDGKVAFEENTLDEALDLLQAALAIDSETRPAKELLPKVKAAILERDYGEAMSAGYAAIAVENFEKAKKDFAKAKQLKPNASDPGIGITQANNGIAQARIDRLFAGAAKYEQQEQWHEAVKNYQKLIEIDTSLVQAITGKARAEARAKLDDRLQELLDDPLTLGQSKRNQYARKVLADARALNTSTPRLQGQIEQLESALTQSLIPITVSFQSDTSTNVTIYHVGRLGNFSEREIALKPGRYTVVGTRQGYRDVRQEIVVDPSQEAPTVTIRCAEKLNSANSG
ncbi:hypothetical protein [Microbulbifer celer]|uniref:PEGA domain-containing protein n=1 Tax=Microbulbifer celer TaxID=435905 RepID=A0ABW3U2W2_9GAMM|nr:hypothetical protein [Microbulbifer celer]UFN56176.1 hypothetical protein LPW13_11380 [Microbulbifer celer]